MMNGLSLIIQVMVKASLLLFILGCAEERPRALRIGTNLWPGYEPLYLAQHLGYLDSEKFKLVELPSATDAMRLLRNGALEGATLTLDEALRLAGQGVAIKIVLVFDFSAGGDAVIAKPDIQQFDELKNKTVAVEETAVGFYLLSRALEIYGMTKNQLDIVWVESNNHEKTYDREDISAVVTFEPTKSKLIERGGRELFSSKQIPGEIIDVLVFNSDVLNENYSDIRGFVGAWFDAINYLKKNKKRTAAYLAPRTGQSANSVMQGFVGLHFPDDKENEELFRGNGAALRLAITRLQKMLIREGKLIHKIDEEELLATEFWREY